MRRLALATFVFTASLTAASAQQQPYAGLDARPIKALSEQQIDDLKAGRGMGMAKAAELNGYPGPMHVLELADELELTAEQKETTEKQFEPMQPPQTAAGRELVEAERNLDRQFASRTITSETLKQALARIGEL